MNGYGLTDKGIVRKENQDYFCLELLEQGNLAICVVCDGMGGAKAGNVASRVAAETFVAHVLSETETLRGTETLVASLNRAITASNQAVYRLAQFDEAYKGMGTTLVGIVAAGTAVAIVNVGDSRAYHITRRGIEQITRDHSVVEDMIDRGDITREEALRHPNRNLITKALGTEAEVFGDLFLLEIKPGDRLLLCSDGLTSLVGSREIFEELRRHTDLQKGCEMLMHLAIAKGAPDNVTVLLMEK